MVVHVCTSTHTYTQRERAVCVICLSLSFAGLDMKTTKNMGIMVDLILDYICRYSDIQMLEYFLFVLNKF